MDSSGISLEQRGAALRERLLDSDDEIDDTEELAAVERATRDLDALIEVFARSALVRSASLLW